MRYTLDLAVAWIVLGYDPAGTPNAEAVDYLGILSGKQAEVADALSRMAVKCREGKLNIEANISVMRQLIACEEAVELAYSDVYSKGYPNHYELETKDSLFFVLPKPVQTTNTPISLTGDSFSASNMSWKAGLIEPITRSEAIELPTSNEQDDLCRYWLRADNCTIDSKSLKRTFRKGKKPTGRPSQYDWEDIFVKVFAKIYENGFPDKQATLESWIIESSGNEDMSISNARKKAQKFWHHRLSFIDE